MELKLISHRGNTTGPNPKKENHPNYIEEALRRGYDVEVDVWYTDKLMFGHDFPQYEVDEYLFFITWRNKLWVHCKNFEAINYLKKQHSLVNYFWHETDTITLTSENYLWAYPGNQPIKNSIAVMPELYNDDLSQCVGICSDYIQNYNK
jgi:hypothetical protein